MLWPGLEHLGHLLEKDSEGGVLVSDQRECGGWVSPASPFLLLTFTPEGLLRNLRYWEQYCKRQECSIREEPRPGNGTAPGRTSHPTKLWRQAIGVRPVYPRGIYSRPVCNRMGSHWAVDFNKEVVFGCGDGWAAGASLARSGEESCYSLPCRGRGAHWSLQ